MSRNDEDSRARAEAEFKDRLRSTRQRLGQEGNTDSAGSAKSNSAGYAGAMRLSSEFISAILVGAAIGYAIDKLAGTSPWGMIVFLLLGFVAGIVNILRASKRMASGEQAGDAGTGGSVADDDD